MIALLMVWTVGVTSALAQDTPENSATKRVETKSDTNGTAKKTRSWMDDPIIHPEIWGYCPVSYFEKNKATSGDAKFRSAHNGKMYHLTSTEMKEKFEANPETYVPAYGGLCATALGGSYNNHVPADPEVFNIFRNRLYLFSSQRALNAFLRQPRWFVLRADKQLFEPAIEGYCPVTYQLRTKAMVGLKQVRHEYNGKTYYFMNKISRAEFIGDPQRYAPQYDGYCAQAMTKGHRYPVDPTFFFISYNKTYLFHDELSMVKFTMRPPSNIKKADEQWAVLQSAEKKKTATAAPPASNETQAPKTTTTPAP